MKKLTLSNFSGGMVQRISPDDYTPGEWGYLQGFVPEDDKTIRSQWGIQSIGGEAREWVGTDVTFETNGAGKLVPVFATGSVNTSDVISIYPLTSGNGTYMVAIKEDGTVWWAKMPESDADYTTANAVVWEQIVVAQNRGFSIYESYLTQPYILVESNPDYRFICDLPLEVYKYIKEPQSGSHGGYTATGTYPNVVKTAAALPVEDVTDPYNTPPANPWYLDFTKDALPDGTDDNENDTGNVTIGGGGYTRSLSSAVLIHSRRYYRDGRLTRTKDYNTKKTVTSKVTATNTTKTLTVGSNHGFVVNDLIEVFIGDTNYDGFQQITATSATTITYIGTSSANETVAVTGATKVVQRFHRNQTAVVAYVDPYSDSVKVVTFPNFRRWPMHPVRYKDTATYESTLESDQSKLFSAEYRPMQSWVVTSTGGQKAFPFIDEYPYDQTVAGSKNIWSPDIEDFNATPANRFNIRTAYPKYNSCFQPYTYLDSNKALLPGKGLVPRCFTGTMLGNLLILGDIEWKEDSSETFLSDKRLVPNANKVAGSSTNSNFGLRDSNTEPHRGFFYFSQDDIDTFDPRSIFRASATDTRISGMHALNNKIIAITSTGGDRDGVISFSGNFAQVHPYTPGVSANPLAVRKEIILGGVGTADADDWYNHGNPQTCVWPKKNVIAFIDRSGYTYITNDESCVRLDDRYPIIGKPSPSTVNDHVASVGDFLFVYKSGYLFTYTINGTKGAWYMLQRPQVNWQSYPNGTLGNIQQYNVIRSMRGTDNELYLIVHSYYIECDNNWEPLPGEEPVLGGSRIMRYTLSGNNLERGMQDGELLDNLTIVSQTIGTSTESKKIFWRKVGINFYAPHPSQLVGVGVQNNYPELDNTKPGQYKLGNYQTPEPNLITPNTLVYSTPLVNYNTNDNFYNFEFTAGVGPQKIISVKAVFRGDVLIEAFNIFYTGDYELLGQNP